MSLPVAALLVPASAAAILVALTSDEWGRVTAAPPKCQHEVLGQFGLWQGRLHVDYLPNVRLPWLVVPPPLRVPWIPLRYLVRGPTGVRQFQKISAYGGRDPFLFPEALPNLTDEVALTQPVVWELKHFVPILGAAEATLQFGVAALAMLLFGWLAQLSACIFARCEHQKPTAVLRLASLFYLGVTMTVYGGFVQYVGGCHNRQKQLVSEFIFDVTDGSIGVWPVELELQLDAGAYAFAAGGVLALVCAFVSWADSRRPERRIHAAAPSQVVHVPELRWIRSDAPQARVDEAGGLECDLAIAEERVRAHRRGLICTTITLNVMLAAALAAVALTLGRTAVERAIQNALRGPQKNIKQTARGIQRAQQAVLEAAIHSQAALRDATIASGRAGWGAARGAGKLCGKAATGAGHAGVSAAGGVGKLCGAAAAGAGWAGKGAAEGAGHLCGAVANSTGSMCGAAAGGVEAIARTSLRGGHRWASRAAGGFRHAASQFGSPRQATPKREHPPASHERKQQLEQQLEQQRQRQQQQSQQNQRWQKQQTQQKPQQAADSQAQSVPNRRIRPPFAQRVENWQEKLRRHRKATTNKSLGNELAKLQVASGALQGRLQALEVDVAARRKRSKRLRWPWQWT